MDMDMAKFEQLGFRKPRVGTRVRNGHLLAVAGEWNGALDGEAGLARERLGAGEVKGHPSINHSLDKTLERTGVLVSSILL